MPASPGANREDGNTLLIDDGRFFGQAVRPGRLAQSGPSRFLEGFIKLFMLPNMIMLVFMSIPLIIWPLVLDVGLGIHLDQLRGIVIALTWILGWMFGVMVMDSWRAEAVFDRETRSFHSRTWILGREFKSRAFPLDVFTAISVGKKLHDEGGVWVVRLLTAVEGYRLDAWLTGIDLEQARAVAQRLHEYTGLPVQQEPLTTGPQHALDDLRGNEWMIPRLLRRKPVVTADTLPSLAPLGDRQLQALGRVYAPGEGGFVVVWSLAGLSAIAFLFMDKAQGAHWLLLLPVVIVGWLHWRYWRRL